MATKAEKIKALLAKGMKPTEIAKKIGCDFRYVYRFMTKKRKYTKRVKATDSGVVAALNIEINKAEDRLTLLRAAVDQLRALGY